jgi:NADPH:quinone reductase-like Zn-dependent oxidoreductase
VRAVRFTDFGPPEVLREVTVPDPECPADGVLVRVEAAAVNHLDVDERAGTSGFTLHPSRQLGREGAGTVVEVGREVDETWMGRRVIVSAYPACGHCVECQRGLINVCRNFARPGIDVPGTYAEIVAAPVRGVFALPDAIDADQAACLQLGLGTAWHATLGRGRLRPGEALLVTGAGGGVGSAAVQVGVLAGADVIAVASSPERRALALELGARVCLEPGLDLVSQVREATAGAGVDVIVDGAGGSFVQSAVAMMRPAGRYVLYGAHGGEHTDLDLIALFRSYTALIASRGWLMEDMRHVIAETARGRLRVHVGHRLELSEAAAAHHLLADRASTGKVVLVP